MRLFIFLFVFLQALTGCGQHPQKDFVPVVDTHAIRLGNAVIPLEVYRYNSAASPFLVHIHHNERTADSVLHHYLKRNGGSTLNLRNNRERNVSFSLDGTRYQFDPNRMFTATGLAQSMKTLGPYHPDAADSISVLASCFLSLLPDSLPIIALHNTTEAAYSLLSYMAGGTYAAETKAYFRNAENDPDDFVLTTDVRLFELLRTTGLNVVLQDNEQVADDGSMSYYFGKKGQIYVNVEAEHGHFNEQLNMLQVVLKTLEHLK